MTGQEARLEELLSVCDRLLSEGKGFRLEELCRDEPSLLPELRRRLAAVCRMDALARGAPETHQQEIGLETSAQVTPAGHTMWPAQLAPPAPDLLFLRPPEAPDEIGRLGDFRVLGVLGRGGMGIVLRGEDTALGREVALKCMKPELAAVKEARERFLREAKAAARIDDTHVAPIHQVSEARGVPFLVMPLLKGRPLSARLDELRQAGTRMPVAEAVRIAREMALGLSAAHDLGIIHRDIKPANVWLKEGGGAVLLDFGLASVRGGQEGLTVTGQVMGTPSYMAPEQAECGEIDARADLFSLGCVLHEMLSGERAFTGPSVMAILAMLASHTPPLITTAPPALASLVTDLLAKKPAGRPRSAAEVVERLRRFEQGEPGLTTTTPYLRPTPKTPPPRKPPLVAAGIAALVLVAAGVGFALLPRGGKPHVEPRGPSLLGMPRELPSSERVLRLPREMVPLGGRLQARMWAEDGTRAAVLLGVDPAAVPVRDGDKVRIEADLDEPAHVYILWLASDGGIIPLYPWNPGDDIIAPKAGPVASPGAVRHVATPPGYKGWPCDDSDGLETVLVLARRDPLPAGMSVAALLGEVPRNRYINPRENTIQTYRDGKLVSEKPSNWVSGPRGIKGKTAVALDDALLVAVQRLAPHFELIQAVRFAHVKK